MCSYASRNSVSNGSGKSKRKPKSTEFSVNFERAIDLVQKVESPQHFVDSLKYRILSHESFNETYESLRPLCFMELMWLIERIEVENIYKQAAEKDEQLKQKITSAR
ncbi:hypothetical protein [Vibrio phage S4-7]|nr:hypothetical protein [Vibrio phage S4-7]